MELEGEREAGILAVGVLMPVKEVEATTVASGNERGRHELILFVMIAGGTSGGRNFNGEKEGEGVYVKRKES
ncbi:conserved hypothetical protein [Ricinus communis]|uniref:Uncharacterized protein n=1 Tax=Ricinus communis TaxID=3988 RepID=B9SRP6_RICCO|nr:conserved hypothetical protein [Ricinus communis]